MKAIEPDIRRSVFSTPLGCMEAVSVGNAIREVRFLSRPPKKSRGREVDPLLRKCRRQLEEYFAGRRRIFSLPLDPRGTEFERDVWRRLLRIPYGRTASYKDVAASLGRPRALRAVGAANGKNPIVLIIPCHRVIGHDGRLVGYGSGLWRKRKLLEHERKFPDSSKRLGRRS